MFVMTIRGQHSSGSCPTPMEMVWNRGWTLVERHIPTTLRYDFQWPCRRRHFKCRSVAFLFKKPQNQITPSVCSDSFYLLHINVSICTTTLWHTSGWILLCSSCVDLAAMHKCFWLIQYIPLEPTCLSSSVPILHVQILKEDEERWMDVFGWNFIVHNRLRGNVC